MGHVFISYSHKDRVYVHRLQEALQKQGFEAWIDDRIDYGTSWPKVIQGQLDSCDAFILVLSENSFESAWVQNEVTRARRKDKPIFPLLLSGDPWLSMEAIQYVDVRDGRLPPAVFFQRLSRVTSSRSQPLGSEHQKNLSASRRLQVYLCHASADKAAARILYRNLSADGINVWLDELELLPGQDWQTGISKAIRTSDAVIVCLSNNSITKDGYLHREIRYALEVALEKPEGTIFLIPIKLDDCAIPDSLRKWHSLNLYYNGKSFDRSGYNSLLYSLSLREERLSIATPLRKRDDRSFIDRILDFFGLPRNNIAPNGYSEIIVEGNSTEALREISKRLGIDITQSTRKEFDFLWNTKAIFANFPILNPLPILISQERNPSDTHIEKLKDRLIKLPNSKGRIALLYLDCSIDVFEVVRAKFIEFSKAFAYDVIVFHPTIANEIVKANDPQKALRNFVLSKINLNTISPYITTGPTPEDFFFGREQELREIENHIRNVSYAIVGGRRIGKTSILNRLHKVRLSHAGFRTIFFDCSIVQSYDAFMDTKVLNWQPEFKNGYSIRFRDLLEAPPNDKPLVLLLDEADKLVPVDRVNGWKLFNNLRYLSNAKQMQIVLSGERILRDALKDPKGPLFNFPNEILLGPLDYQAVEVLVTEPMKTLDIRLIDTKEIVHRIWEFTSGHPNVVQRLCRRLIEKINQENAREVNIEIVDEVMQDLNFQRNDYLETYWENASNLEKIITLIITDNPARTSLTVVREAIMENCGILPSTHEVDQALQRLIYLRAILKQSSSGYEFAVKSFPTVLAGTVTLKDMLEILAEKYRGGEE